MGEYKATAKGSGWSNHKLSKDKLFKLDKFKFEVHLILLGHKEQIPEHSKNSIAPIVNGQVDQHKNDMDELKQSVHLLSKQVEQMQTQIQEQIQNQMANVMIKINEIKEENQNNQFNVKNWLDNIGYSQYLDTFSEFDTLPKIQNMTKDQFDSLSVQGSDVSTIWIAIQSLQSIHH